MNVVGLCGDLGPGKAMLVDLKDADAVTSGLLRENRSSRRPAVRASSQALCRQ